MAGSPRSLAPPDRYAGRSNDLERRRKEHDRHKKFRDQEFLVLFRTDSYLEQRRTEQFYYLLYDPDLNKRNPYLEWKSRQGCLRSGLVADRREGKRMTRKRGRGEEKELYTRGDCIVLPLFDELFAVAWIAWSSGGEILGHLYAPLTIPELTTERLVDRTWASPLLICRFGDLGILRGKWRIISIPESRKLVWPIPETWSTSFAAIRQAEIAVTEPGHPNRVVSRRSSTVEAAQMLPSEDLYGYRAVELELSMLITPMEQQCRDPASGGPDASFSERDYRKEPKKLLHWLPRGTVFALPLEHGGFNHGVVVHRSAGMALTSFFGTIRAQPNADPTADLDAPMVWTTRMVIGEWAFENVKVLGQIDTIPSHLAAEPVFRRTTWVYPSGRHDFRVSYDPLDLERELTCTRVDQADVADLFPDWRLGGLGVAQVLARL